MHPVPIERAHSLRNGRLQLSLLWLFAALVCAGCGTRSTDAPLLAPDDTLFSATDAERAAALAVIDSVKQDAMQNAFRRLPHYAFTRRVHTEQLTPAGSVQTAQLRVVRFPPPDSAQDPIVLHASSSGRVQSGWLGRFAPTSDVDSLPTGLAEDLLPEDPAYVEPRTREEFRYRLREDTLDGRPVQVVEIHAEPGDVGAAQPIRHARLYVDPTSNQLVGLYLVRADNGILFREDSRSLVLLRPAPDSGWVPASVRARARVQVPLQTPEAFRTASSFFAYRAIN